MELEGSTGKALWLGSHRLLLPAIHFLRKAPRAPLLPFSPWLHDQPGGDGNVVLSDAHFYLWPQIFLSHPLPLQASLAVSWLALEQITS